MDNPNNKARLEKVYLMLVEMARGNFSYQIERTDKKDELEALTALVNMTAEEIRDSFLHQGYVNLHDSYKHVVQMLFILDQHFRILEISKGAKKILQTEDHEFHGIAFEKLLANNSKKAWVRMEEKIGSSCLQERVTQFFFITKPGLILPAFCHIITFPEGSVMSGKTIVTAFEMVQSNTLMEGKLRRKIQKELQERKAPIKKMLKEKIILHTLDIEKIRTAGEYIKNYPEMQLISLKELAHSFGTNEFKLKRGFKELYGMTVFQFLKNERLRKAHVLVQYSDKPFKKISLMTGFKTPTHFSREFKLRYGYSPRDLRSIT